MIRSLSRKELSMNTDRKYVTIRDEAITNISMKIDGFFFSEQYGRMFDFYSNFDLTHDCFPTIHTILIALYVLDVFSNSFEFTLDLFIQGGKQKEENCNFSTIMVHIL